MLVDINLNLLKVLTISGLFNLAIIPSGDAYLKFLYQTALKGPDFKIGSASINEMGPLEFSGSVFLTDITD